MKKYKLVSTLFLLMVFCLTCVGISYGAEQGTPEVIFNGEKLVFKDQEPVMVNGALLVPYDSLVKPLEKIGVNIFGGDYGIKDLIMGIPQTTTQKTMQLVIDKQTGYFNAESYSLKTPFTIINDIVMLPIEDISTQYNCSLTWSGGIKDYEIKYQNKEFLELSKQISNILNNYCDKLINVNLSENEIISIENKLHDYKTQLFSYRISDQYTQLRYNLNNAIGIASICCYNKKSNQEQELLKNIDWVKNELNQ